MAGKCGTIKLYSERWCFIVNFLKNINWTNSFCKRAGLVLAAVLLFFVALSTRTAKTKADTNDSSSAKPADSSSQQEVKFDTVYVKLDNDEMTNTGLIALDDKDHHITSGAADLVSIYSYLFNAKGEMIMTTGSTNICGKKEMFEQLNLMISDFSAQTGLKTIMVRNAAYKVDDKVYKSQFDIPDEKSEQSAAAAQDGKCADGCYEHLSGLAVDFQLYEADKGAYPEYTGEGQYAWINENCYKYGFVLRYPADKTDITGVEAKKNHYRYVSKEYAQVMHDNNLVLEELYGFLQKYTFEKPLSVQTPSGSRYIFYYVKKDKDNTFTTVPMPQGRDGEKTGTVSADAQGGLYVCCDISQFTSQQAPQQESQTSQTQVQKTE